jgi:hypothetical protein
MKLKNIYENYWTTIWKGKAATFKNAAFVMRQQFNSEAHFAMQIASFTSPYQAST